MRKYRIQFSVDLTVHDDFAITRVTENVDGWREQMYDIDENGAAAMLARGLLTSTLSNIDGWADMPDGAADVTPLRVVDVEHLEAN